MPSRIIAIDGPSGVGKTTTSRLVARELGLPHIDTGAMYRALALAATREGIDTRGCVIKKGVPSGLGTAVGPVRRVMVRLAPLYRGRGR